MKTWIALVIVCLILTACTAAGQIVQTPGAVRTTAAGGDYGQPAAPAAAPTNTQPAQQAPPPTATVPPAAAPPTATLPAQAPPATQPPATQPPVQPTATQPPPPPAATPTTPPAAAVNPTAVPVTGPAVVVPSDELLDYRVASTNGIPIGDVEDLIIDLNKTTSGVGQAPLLIISSELNDDWLIPVPWQYAQLRHDLKAVILPVEANQLMNAPGFSEDFYPADLLSAWQADLDRYWQNPAAVTAPPAARPPSQAGAAVAYITAKDLLDMDVVDPRGFELGEVKDLAIDWQNSQQVAQFSYLIIDRGETLGLGGENIPIPWRLINPNPMQEVIPLSLDAQVLRTAPSFNDLAWPNLYTEPWVTDLTTFWNTVQ